MRFRCLFVCLIVFYVKRTKLKKRKALMFGILFGQVLNCDSRCYLSGPWEATDVLHENSYYIVLSMVSSTLHFVLGIVLSLGRLYRIADTYFILGIVLSLGRFCHIADSYRP